MIGTRVTMTPIFCTLKDFGQMLFLTSHSECCLVLHSVHFWSCPRARSLSLLETNKSSSLSSRGSQSRYYQELARKWVGWKKGWSAGTTKCPRSLTSRAWSLPLNVVEKEPSVQVLADEPQEGNREKHWQRSASPKIPDNEHSAMSK